MEPTTMSENNCGCCCSYQTPHWWVTMRFTDAGPGTPAPAPPTAAPPQATTGTTQQGGSSSEGGLGGLLNTVGGVLGGALGGLI